MFRISYSDSVRYAAIFAAVTCATYLESARGAEQAEAVHAEERLPVALHAARAVALAFAPKHVGELAEHAHALEARARERQRVADEFVEVRTV